MPDIVGERGERLLDFRRSWCAIAGERQREQRHHAVRLDLEQALRHPPRLPRREVPIEDQKALVPVFVDPQIGEGIAGTVSDLRADHGIFRKITRDRCEISLICVVVAHDDHVRRRNRAPGNTRKPTLGQDGGRGLVETVGPQAAQVEPVAGELGMPLPLDPQGAEPCAEVVDILRRRRGAKVPAQRR